MPRLVFNPFTGAFDFVQRPGEGVVVGETPSGVIDGVNKVFTTANDFEPGSERLFYNGQRLLEGVGNDYTISESGGSGSGFDTLTLAFPPKSGPGDPDVLLVDYNKG